MQRLNRTLMTQMQQIHADKKSVFIRSTSVICVLLIFFQTSFSQPSKEEAKSAFEYLNKVRQNPGKFSKEIGAELNKIEPLPSLIWNDTLAKVAELKAMDMGKRNFFAHVNPEGKGINIMVHEAGYLLPPEWIEDKKENFFESINAGTETGIGAIQDLILDKYDKGKGHRKHLLGMNDFYRELTHIGIGHVKIEGSKYTWYTVVIVAKQK